ncbi:MAG: hypothetical protein ACRDZX_16665, partial [Acidimicrobiales bacterium]
MAGGDTAGALDRALEDLGRSRGLWPGDASVSLVLLSSLAAEVSSRLPRAVEDARARCSALVARSTTSTASSVVTPCPLWTVTAYPRATCFD